MTQFATITRANTNFEDIFIHILYNLYAAITLVLRKLNVKTYSTSLVLFRGKLFRGFVGLTYV